LKIKIKIKIVKKPGPALEALSDGVAGDVDVLARDEVRGGDGGAHGQQRVGAHAELCQLALQRHRGGDEVVKLRLVQRTAGPLTKICVLLKLSILSTAAQGGQPQGHRGGRKVNAGSIAGSTRGHCRGRKVKRRVNRRVVGLRVSY